MAPPDTVSGYGSDGWAGVPHAFRAGAPLGEPWESVFGPLRGRSNGLVTVGQIGQSLDGRIATPSGHSHYINGAEGLAHLHRLRALMDAVLVGVGTATVDDPQLTVRRVTGPSPARIVVDPRGRLKPTARLLADDGVRRLIVTADTRAARSARNSGGSGRTWPNGVEIIGLPAPDGRIAPADILRALAARGLRRVLVEGGADTVSRFLAAGCLDRLHVMVAPLIVGGGPAGLTLAPIARMDQALRIPCRIHRLGDDVLFDCDLSAHRAVSG